MLKNQQKKTCTNLGDGSVLIEMDTARVFVYDRENDSWYQVKPKEEA